MPKPTPTNTRGGIKRQRCPSGGPRTPALRLSPSILLFLSAVWLAAASAGARRAPWSLAPLPSSSSSSSLPWGKNRATPPALSARGGGGDRTEPSASKTSSNHCNEDDEEDDEERYSRQVYTMGARAHGLIRSSRVYLDGPARSGLLWESAKNLALSGVGSLVVVVDDENDSDDARNDASAPCPHYHDPALDDLGRTYLRGALAELGDLAAEDPSAVLVGFLRRLNPALAVSTISRRKLLSGEDEHEEEERGEGVLLCVDRPCQEQAEWNEACRKAGLAFVAVETAGVYGRVFCDFGPTHAVHDADGEAPLVVPLDRVEALSPEEGSGEGARTATTTTTILVRSVEGEHHDVSGGDTVVFLRSDGSVLEDCRGTVARVETPERIRVRIDATETQNSETETIDAINAEAVAFSREKQIEEISFEPLAKAVGEATDKGTAHAVFTPCDLDKSFDETRRGAVFGCFQALGSYAETHGRMPVPGEEDEPAFRELATEAAGEYGSESESDDWKKHCATFLKTCPAKFVPLQAIFGAIASQECLKAVSGLYNPVRQFLLYDCDEILDTTETKKAKKTAAEAASEDDEETTGLSYLLGPEVARRLRAQKLFVVGSGAIGCEILKNAAAMGLGTFGSGSLVVTDMDTIEKSNLSRQLLFRDEDIGKFKSRAAEEAVLRMNPSVRVESHTSRVGDGEDPGPFDPAFWSGGVDVILNALDNIEARLFMDGQCVANKKALVDAGTLGSKGNVQVVVPHQSESYGASADPPEPAIPVCTLKNFPYAISHTIQWGRDLFDGLFVRRPVQANQYAPLFAGSGTGGLAGALDEELGDEAALEAARELAEDLAVLHGEDNGAGNEALLEQKAIEWAVALGKKLFQTAIEELLLEHPLDKLDEDGERFWSGSRKPPQPLSFSLDPEEQAAEGAASQREEINKNMIDFVRSASRLRYETYAGIPSDSRENAGIVSRETAMEALAHATENENAARKEEDSETTKRSKIQGLLSPLEGLSSSDQAAPRSLSPAEFEKDDESNDHIAFITAASNLRAICYGIAPVDAMETRKVAGKIVPAMITTTAFVSALSCIELVKLTQGMPLNRYRNAFINLALPFFAFTSPLPAEEFPGVRGETHTLWDQINIKEGKKAAKAGGLTVRRLLRRIQKKAHAEDPDAIQVSNISIGPIMIYANFLHEDDEELLNKSIWKVIEEAVQSGAEFDEEFSRDGPVASDDSAATVSISSASFVDLAVSVEDTETYEEVELPPVRVFRS